VVCFLLLLVVLLPLLGRCGVEYKMLLAGWLAGWLLLCVTDITQEKRIDITQRLCVDCKTGKARPSLIDRLQQETRSH
jgi:hypothetical protein